VFRWVAEAGVFGSPGWPTRRMQRSRIKIRKRRKRKMKIKSKRAVGMPS
jgi:hypothetical protein